MSEPVTQAEIEDVLSSIRRLVSEDVRAEATSVAREPASPAPSAAVAARSSSSATRLVLTPALRVPNTAAQAMDAVVEANPDSADPVAVTGWQPDPTASGERAGEERLIPEDMAIADSDPESEFSAEPEGPLPEETGSELSDPDEAPWKDPGATLFQAAGVAGEADLAPVVPRADGGAEDGSVGDDAAEPADRVSAVVQNITELEAKVARSQEQWEPDGRSSDPYAGSNIETLQWRDHYDAEEDLPDEAQFHHPHAEPDVVSEPTSATVDPAVAIAEEVVTAETLETLAADETYLDEDSLRELVSEIVREELQGALGERITRNVRKLVRREIHRALAAQDLI